MDEVGHHARGDVADAERPAPSQRALEHLGGHGRDARAREQRAGVVGCEPAVGRDVEGSRQVAGGDEDERGREVVDVDDLDGRLGVADAQRRPSQDDARGQAFGARADHRRRPERGHGHARVVLAPLGEQPLDLGTLDGGREVRVGAQWRVLGERDRVARPRAVHRRARDAHDAVHADRARGREDPARPLDVDARHERLVGDGVDDAGEVDNGVDALEDGLQVRAGDVDPVEFERAAAPLRLADVERDDARDVGMVGEPWEQPLPDEARRPRDGDRRHVHTLPRHRPMTTRASASRGAEAATDGSSGARQRRERVRGRCNSPTGSESGGAGREMEGPPAPALPGGWPPSRSRRIDPAGAAGGAPAARSSTNW